MLTQKLLFTVSVRRDVNTMRVVVIAKFVHLHLKSAAGSVTCNLINGLLVRALQLVLQHISEFGVLLKHPAKTRKKVNINHT